MKKGCCAVFKQLVLLKNVLLSKKSKLAKTSATRLPSLEIQQKLFMKKKISRLIFLKCYELHVKFVDMFFSLDVAGTNSTRNYETKCQGIVL